MQNNLWNDVLKRLEKRINRPSFNTWIRPISLISVEQNQIQIGVPDEVFVYWLSEYYVNVIADILSDCLGQQPEISFVVMDALETTIPPEESAEEPSGASGQPTPPRASATAAAPTAKQMNVPSVSKPAVQLPLHRNSGQARSGRPPEHQLSFHEAPVAASAPVRQRSTARSLNARYTFDSFVVGASNRFAHAAALAVSDQTAVNYNPLFIYGGVGLGKTHLLHAVGNHVAAQRQTDRILYLSSEQFINELISSIREDRMPQFREKYRNIDLFLVDDIQFIAGKERTQEEFFHTFNTLYHERKQIVLTSDCPPKKIATIAEQLRSRFEWGLIADIQPPDLETRIAILKNKAELQHLELPDEVAIYIAHRVKSNIRELEGSLSKIRAYSTFNQQAVTLGLAQHVLHDIFDTTPKRVTIELVQQIVANHYQIDLASMKSAIRSRNVTFPRQIAMYLSRELTGLSLPDIGKNFGGRDHTTVIHACKKVERIQTQDTAIKANIMQLREQIQA